VRVVAQRGVDLVRSKDWLGDVDELLACSARRSPGCFGGGFGLTRLAANERC
jgi:hypothetical protein